MGRKKNTISVGPFSSGTGPPNTAAAPVRSFRFFNYFDEREFDSEADLMAHQKSTNFRCAEPGCGVKCHAASALQIHFEQVHGKMLKEIPNARPDRRELNAVNLKIQGRSDN